MPLECVTYPLLSHHLQPAHPTLNLNSRSQDVSNPKNSSGKVKVEKKIQ